MWLPRLCLTSSNRRIKRRGDRPLLKGTPDPTETLRKLMEQRDPVYAEG